MNGYKLALWVSWMAFAAFATGYAVAQSVRGPNSLPGCIYNTATPSLTAGQSITLQCDAAGRLRVNTTS